MANPYRPNIVPPVTSGIMPPLSRAVPPGVGPLIPPAFGVLPAHQYITQGNYSTSFQQSPSQTPMMNVVPAPMSRIYAVPGTLPIKNSPVNPAKFMEEQRKLEKERNFQMQQQRLKQFTVSGKKGSLKADSLIDSMFGKIHPKQSSLSQSPPLSTVPNGSSKCVKSNFELQNKPVINLQQKIPNEQSANLQNASNMPFCISSKKDKKELDDLMMKCSNLTGPQKANKFTKLAVKEIVPSTQQRPQFVASTKACDWKNVQGLDEVFVQKKQRFPVWCKSEYVPEIYKKIEEYVTEQGQHPPDTKLLFPILMSSCLPQSTLGQIWEMVNQSAPGNLTNEEMYAALALIAVVQAGHAVKTVDTLHQLQSCPIPQLQCFNPPIPAEESTKATEDENAIHDTFAHDATDALTTQHQVLRPSAISLSNMSNVNSTQLPNSSNIPPSGFTSSPDDDFDDFKSATPTAVNFVIPTPTLEPNQNEDEFDDFKQAAVPDFASMHTTIVDQDLMSPEEDKYNAFRILQQTVDDCPGKSEANSNDIEVHNKLTENESQVTGLFQEQRVIESNISHDLAISSEIDKNDDDDDFGDFLHVAPSVVKQVESLTTEFADFANFNDANFELDVGIKPQPNQEPGIFNDSAFIKSNVNFLAENNVQTHALQSESSSSFCGDEDFGDFASFNSTPKMIYQPHDSQGKLTSASPLQTLSRADNDYGDFACSISTITNKIELGPEFSFFRNGKDNISLAESQSVSSLELGTFDGGCCSGESKSSLSRQGSIPSLDLKSNGLEGHEGEESFGEFQNVGFIPHPTDSPSLARKPCDIDTNHVASIQLQAYQPPTNVSLVDKYSVIRSEVKKEEDQYVSSWIRCLQSSVNILQNTMKIFNQMSCSSVCSEVLHTEEGKSYIKDVIEVYKITCRISVASKSSNKQTVQVLDLLKEASECWNTICGFFSGTNLMPEEKSLDFSEAVLHAGVEDNIKACGLCLLNVDAKISSALIEEVPKLSYGGRNYHNTCANLWVNCVEPLLPSLCLPQLL